MCCICESHCDNRKKKSAFRWRSARLAKMSIVRRTFGTHGTDYFALFCEQSVQRPLSAEQLNSFKFNLSETPAVLPLSAADTALPSPSLIRRLIRRVCPEAFHGRSNTMPRNTIHGIIPISAKSSTFFVLTTGHRSAIILIVVKVTQARGT